MQAPSTLKNQAAAVVGIIILAVLAVAPWLVGSHILKPKATQWNEVIDGKNKLLQQKSQLEDELRAYQNMAEKKEVNERYRKNIEQTNLESLQGFINSGKYSLYGFKTAQMPEIKGLRFSFSTPYNTLGQLLTEMWNTFQFVEIDSLVMKPSPNKPDEEVVITLVIRMP